MTDLWVTTALANDEIVADLLLRLKQSTAEAAPPHLPPLPPPSMLTWGCRRGRSKPSSAVKKDRDLMMRCSPTTPLSWNGSEDSSRPSDLSSGGRSKGTYVNDSIAFSSANKRSKRKKSFSELQEEETLLCREGTYLKTELETLHVTLKKQKLKSENLKRFKTDLHQQSAFGVASKPYYPEGLSFRQANDSKGSVTDYVQTSNDINMHEDYVVAAAAAANSFKAEKGFVIPDLNMIPSEDDTAFGSLDGFSL